MFIHQEYKKWDVIDICQVVVKVFFLFYKRVFILSAYLNSVILELPVLSIQYVG